MTEEIVMMFVHDERHHIMIDIRAFVGHLNLKIAKHLYPFDDQQQFEAMNNVTPWKVDIDWSKEDEEK